MTNLTTQSNVETTVQVKRGRGRPSLDAATKSKREVKRVVKLLVNSHNSNPLSVAMKGIRNASHFQFTAQKMVDESNGKTVEVQSYGVRKSAKTLADAIANAGTLKSNKSAMAVIVFESRRAGNVASDETKAFLKRISATGATFTAEEVPEQLKQFL